MLADVGTPPSVTASGVILRFRKPHRAILPPAAPAFVSPRPRGSARAHRAAVKLVRESRRSCPATSAAKAGRILSQNLSSIKSGSLILRKTERMAAELRMNPPSLLRKTSQEQPTKTSASLRVLLRVIFVKFRVPLVVVPNPLHQHLTVRLGSNIINYQMGMIIC